MALDVGDVLGDYEILEELGEGRYGTVYRVKDVLSGVYQEYAIKVLYSKVASDSTAVRREAELWKAVCLPAHPHIVRFHRFLTQKRGSREYHFHVCDFIPHGSLRDWLDDPTREKPTWEESIQLMQGILSGLERLHTTPVQREGFPSEEGIVHRDLKPDNILLEGTRPLITDFGLSRVLNSHLSTRAGKGAIAYASPEDIRGENPAVSMDLWSAAVIFYELLTGKLPFGSLEHTITDRVKNSPPDPLPDTLPRGLCAVLLKALQKDLAERYESAAAFWKAIEDAYPHRVFISYSHDSEEHRQKVRALADRLRAEGLICEIDQYHEEVPPREGWPQWMRNQVRHSEHVLLVFTATYARRFVGDEAAGRGLGASWEGRLVTQQLYNAQGQTLKFIPILLSPGDSRFIPEDLQATTYYDLTREENYEKLYWRLTHQTEKAPEVGSKKVRYPSTPPPVAEAVTVTPIVTLPKQEVIVAPKPGKFSPPLTLADYKAQMVTIPAGKFIRGSTDYPDEQPVKEIELSAYQIGLVPVTVGMYQEFVQATKGTMPDAPNFNKEWKLLDHPIVQVSWNDALAYAKWAGLALPTEAQWEKAARGTDGRKFPWGDEWDSGKCRCSIKEWGDSGGTAAVGSYPEGKSPHGVLDMSGNVWEWCLDWYSNNYYATAPDTDPRGPEKGDYRVLRGGSWGSDNEDDFRCAFRNRLNPGLRGNVRGFRLILSELGA